MTLTGFNFLNRIWWVFFLVIISTFMFCTDKKQTQEPFKLGAQSYSLRAFSVQEAIVDLDSLGFKYVEIYPGHFPVESAPEEKAALKKLLAEHDIKFTAYGVVDFEESEQVARTYFEFAKEMGIEVLSVNPTAKELDFLENLVKEFDIKVAIHNHGPNSRYDTLQSVLDAVKNRDMRIGACIDTGHFMRSDEDPVNCAIQLADRTHLVHLKDIKIFPDKKVFTIQGEGDMDMPSFFKALEKIGYNGPLSLEYEENKENPVPDMEICVKNIKAAISQIGV